VVHCPPFPGSPRYRGEPISAIYDACVRMPPPIEGGFRADRGEPRRCAVLQARGPDAGDRRLPRGGGRPHRAATGAPLGVNVLANAPIHALAVAAATGAAFIRVNQWANAYVANEGFMEGRAAEAMRYRSLLRAERARLRRHPRQARGHAITADRTMPSSPRPRLLRRRCVIATGQRTGDAATLEEIETRKPRRTCRCWSAPASRPRTSRHPRADGRRDRRLEPQAQRGLVERCRSRAGAGVRREGSGLGWFAIALPVGLALATRVLCPLRPTVSTSRWFYPSSSRSTIACTARIWTPSRVFQRSPL
jgi:hypothetical protein